MPRPVRKKRRRNGIQKRQRSARRTGSAPADTLARLDLSAAVWIPVACLVGLAMALCIADVFVPLFWARRFGVQAAVLLPTTVLLTSLLAPRLRKLAQMSRMETDLATRTTWLVITAAMLILAIVVILSAWGFRAALPEHLAQAGRRALMYPAPNYLAELGLAISVAAFVSMVEFGQAVRGLVGRPGVMLSLAFLVACFFGMFIVNTVLPAIDMSRPIWGFNLNFPHGYSDMQPAGNDFRMGLYRPALRLVTGLAVYPFSFYPPLVAVLALPYLLLSENAAYLVHVLLLVPANAACLVIAAALALDGAAVGSAQARRHALIIHVMIVLILGFTALTSYPFVFSIERGNGDIIALLLALTAIWTASRRGNPVWVPVILLSMAAHIKVYPFLLFPILWYLMGRRMILPAVLTNIALLFVMGPAGAFGFFAAIQADYRPPVETVNHAGYIFAALLAQHLQVPISLPILRYSFTGLPLVLCGVGWLALLSLRNRRQVGPAAFMLTVPAMALVPGYSYDYQLVIIYSGVVVLLSRMLLRMARRQAVYDYVLLALVSGVVLAIGRWGGLMEAWPDYVHNKYMWVLMLQVIMLLDVLRQVREQPATNQQRRTAPQPSAT